MRSDKYEEELENKKMRRKRIGQNLSFYPYQASQAKIQEFFKETDKTN